MISMEVPHPPPPLLSNVRINGNCFPEELNFDWTKVFNCNCRGPSGMGVKLGVLRYKRLKVFEDRVLGGGREIFVNPKERRLQEIRKNCIGEVPHSASLIYL
jgi:hypothetical protein